MAGIAAELSCLGYERCQAGRRFAAAGALKAQRISLVQTRACCSAALPAFLAPFLLSLLPGPHPHPSPHVSHPSPFAPLPRPQFYWPLGSDKTVTAWVPLVPVPEGRGPLQFAAGSHKHDLGRAVGIG